MNIYIPSEYEFKLLFDCSCMELIEDKNLDAVTKKYISEIYGSPRDYLSKKAYIGIRSRSWEELDNISQVTTSDGKLISDIFEYYISELKNDYIINFNLDIVEHYYTKFSIMRSIMLCVFNDLVSFNTDNEKKTALIIFQSLSIILLKLQDISKDLALLSPLEIACNTAAIQNGLARNFDNKNKLKGNTLTPEVASNAFKEFCIQNVKIGIEKYAYFDIQGILGDRMKEFLSSYVKKDNQRFMTSLADSKTIVDSEGKVQVENIKDAETILLDMPVSDLLNDIVEVDSYLFKGAKSSLNISSIVEWMHYKNEANNICNIKHLFDGGKRDEEYDNEVRSSLRVALIEKVKGNNDYIGERITISFDFLDMMYEIYEENSNKNPYDIYQKVISSSNTANMQKFDFVYLKPYVDYFNTLDLSGIDLSAQIDDSESTEFGKTHLLQLANQKKNKIYLNISDWVISQINTTKNLIISCGLEPESHNYYVVLESGIKKINKLFRIFLLLDELTGRLKRCGQDLSCLPVDKIKSGYKFKSGIQLSEIISQNFNTDFISNYFISKDIEEMKAKGISEQDLIGEESINGLAEDSLNQLMEVISYRNNVGNNKEFFKSFDVVNISDLKNEMLSMSEIISDTDDDSNKSITEFNSDKFKCTPREVIHYILIICWKLMFPDNFDSNGNWKGIKLYNCGKQLNKFYSYLSDFIITGDPMTVKKIFGLLLLIYQDIGIAGKAVDDFSVSVVEIIDSMLYEIYNQSGFVFSGSKYQPLHCAELKNTTKVYGKANLHTVIVDDFSISFRDTVNNEKFSMLKDNISVFNIFAAIYYGSDYIIKIALKRVDSFYKFNSEINGLKRSHSLKDIGVNAPSHKFIFSCNNNRFMTDSYFIASKFFTVKDVKTLMANIDNEKLTVKEKVKLKDIIIKAETAKQIKAKEEELSAKGVSYNISLLATANLYTKTSYFIDDCCMFYKEKSSGEIYMASSYPASNNSLKYFSDSLMSNMDSYSVQTIARIIYKYEKFPKIALSEDAYAIKSLISSGNNSLLLGDSNEKESINLKDFVNNYIKNCKNVQHSISEITGVGIDNEIYTANIWREGSAHYIISKNKTITGNSWTSTIAKATNSTSKYPKRFVVSSVNIIKALQSLFIKIDLFKKSNDGVCINSKCEDVYCYWNMRLQMLYFMQSAQIKVDLANTIRIGSEDSGFITTKYSNDGNALTKNKTDKGDSNAKFVYCYTPEEAIANLNPKILLRGNILLDSSINLQSDLASVWGINIVNYSDSMYIPEKKRKSLVDLQTKCINNCINEIQLSCTEENELIRSVQNKVKKNLTFIKAKSYVNIGDISRAYNCALEFIRSTNFATSNIVLADISNKKYSAVISRRINKDGFVLRKNFEEDSITWIKYSKLETSSETLSNTFIFYYISNFKLIVNCYAETKVRVEAIDEEDIKELNE